MDLNALNQSVLNLIKNGTNIISFLKDFTVGSAKDVSITYVNANGSESVKSFPNIAKMVASYNIKYDGVIRDMSGNSLEVSHKNRTETITGLKVYETVNNQAWSGTEYTISPKDIGLGAEGLFEFDVLLGFKNSGGAYSECFLKIIVDFSLGYPQNTWSPTVEVLCNVKRNETGTAPDVTITSTKSTSVGSNDGNIIVNIPSELPTQKISFSMRRITQRVSY